MDEQTILALLSATFDFDIRDLNSTQEFIKKTQREKKFCLKVQHMVKDVEIANDQNVERSLSTFDRIVNGQKGCTPCQQASRLEA